jgi:hypothetical protein
MLFYISRSIDSSENYLNPMVFYSFYCIIGFLQLFYFFETTLFLISNKIIILKIISVFQNEGNIKTKNFHKISLHKIPQFVTLALIISHRNKIHFSLTLFVLLNSFSFWTNLDIFPISGINYFFMSSVKHNIGILLISSFKLNVFNYNYSTYKIVYIP